MTIEHRKYDLVQLIMSIQDEKILDVYEEMIRKLKIAAYEAKMKPMTIEELIQRALRSEEDIKAGRLTDIEEVIRESKSW